MFKELLCELEFFLGEEIIEGVTTQKWNLTTVIGEKKNKYTLWVRQKQVEGNQISIPVRFEMKGYNVILGSHYDHYYIQYNEFDVSPISGETFKISTSKYCSK